MALMITWLCSKLDLYFLQQVIFLVINIYAIHHDYIVGKDNDFYYYNLKNNNIYLLAYET